MAAMTAVVAIVTVVAIVAMEEGYGSVKVRKCKSMKV
jgi:hypothetical protein